MLENALVPRASIDEIVGRRTQSLELFQQGYAMIRSAREMAGRAAPNGYLPTFPDNIKYMLESCNERNESDFNAGVTKLVDQAIWDHSINVKIGRAASRVRVWQYWSISVVAVQVKKKTTNH